MKEAPDSAGQNPVYELAEDDGQPLRTVTFERSDGSSEAFSYKDLQSVRYDPAGTVRLHFATAKINVCGRNLLSIWRALRSRRVKLLRVTGNEATTNHEPHIDSIAIAPAKRRE